VNLAVTLRYLFSKSQRIAGGEAGGLRIVTRAATEILRGAAPTSRRSSSTCIEPERRWTNVYDIDCAPPRGAAGRVYAFEPVSQSAGAIEQSARPNRFCTICVFAETVGPRCAPPTGDQ
jgi:hypothetical protein